MNVVHTIEYISTGFELAGVVIIVIGSAYAFVLYSSAILRREATGKRYRAFRQNLGKAILVGLEVLVAADIIRTVSVDPTFFSIGVLGLLVLVRTFLSWSLEVEISGAWPWQRAQAAGVDESEPEMSGGEASANGGDGALRGNRTVLPEGDSHLAAH
jgi:uncharacterized membrane protein